MTFSFLIVNETDNLNSIKSITRPKIVGVIDNVAVAYQWRRIG